jgi:hypothetical protein
MSKYSGSEWVALSLKKELSPLGCEVADVIGQVWRGIYHQEKAARKTDWTNPHHIEFVIFGGLNSFDDDMLTRLIVLCHDRMLRLEIEPCAFRYLRLVFHQRQARMGDISRRMPHMEEHINMIREDCGLEILEVVA